MRRYHLISLCALVAAAIMLFIPTGAHAVVINSQNFNGSLPAGWTVADLEGDGINWERGIYLWPGWDLIAGDFLWVYGAVFETIDTTITTTPINCTNYVNVHVSFDTDFLSSVLWTPGTAILYVRNGGTAWSSILYWDSSHGEQRIDFDVSDWADGQPDLQFKWEFIYDSWFDFSYWAVDNFEVNGSTTTTTTTTTSTTTTTHTTTTTTITTTTTPTTTTTTTHTTTTTQPTTTTTQPTTTTTNPTTTTTTSGSTTTTGGSTTTTTEVPTTTSTTTTTGGGDDDTADDDTAADDTAADDTGDDTAADDTADDDTGDDTAADDTEDDDTGDDSLDDTSDDTSDDTLDDTSDDTAGDDTALLDDDTDDSSTRGSGNDGGKGGGCGC